jgi:hypothetical protein
MLYKELSMTAKQKKAVKDEFKKNKKVSSLPAKVAKTEIVDGLRFTEGLDTRRPDRDVFLDKDDLLDFAEEIREALDTLQGLTPQIQLSPSQRRILQSIRARRLGFIVRSSELALANPNFSPKGWDNQAMAGITQQITTLDELISIVDQIRSILTDQFIISANEGFRLARLFYASVQMWSRTGDSGARAVYDRLNEFFRHRRPTDSGGGTTIPGGGGETEATPHKTKKQLERDAKALITGKKEGKMFIEHEPAYTFGGSYKVIDETFPKTYNTGYYTEEHGPICPNCHFENHPYNNFCAKCGTKLLIEEEPLKTGVK